MVNNDDVLIKDNVLVTVKNKLIDDIRLSKIFDTHGNQIRTIGLSAFYKCNNLTNINIPFYIKDIDENAFEGCENLTLFSFNGSILILENNLFKNCKRLNHIIYNCFLDNSDYSFGEGTFYGCESLTQLTLPKKIKELPDYLFYNCKTLTNIIIPESVKKIGEYTFEGCYNIKEVTINEDTIYSKTSFPEYIKINKK